MHKRLVKNRDFMLLTAGGFISSIGDYLYNIALTISLYSVTNSVGAVALMWLSRGALRIPVQYAAGIITDRCNRKMIIVLTNLISSAAAYLFIFTRLERIWIAYILAFILQSLNDIDMSAEIAILPELVTKEELQYSNAVFSFLESAGIFLSPAIGGLIYKAYGSGVLFQINAVSFLVSGTLFAFIRYSYTNIKKTPSKQGILMDGLEGFNVLIKHADVKIVFLIMGIFAVLGRFYETYKVAVADLLLGIDAEGIIYFDYALAIGGLLVPVLTKVLSKYKQSIAFIITSIVIGIGYLVFGYSHYFIVSFIILIILGATQSLQGIYTKTIIQENIPQEYMGRVFSFYKIVLTLFAILGLLIANPLYKLAGIGNAFMLVAVVFLGLCIKQLAAEKGKINSSKAQL